MNEEIDKLQENSIKKPKNKMSLSTIIFIFVLGTIFGIALIIQVQGQSSPDNQDLYISQEQGNEICNVLTGKTILGVYAEIDSEGNFVCKVPKELLNDFNNPNSVGAVEGGDN